MDFNEFFSKENQEKIKKMISEYLKKYRIDFNDPDTRKIIDERFYALFKAILSLLLFRKL